MVCPRKDVRERLFEVLERLSIGRLFLGLECRPFRGVIIPDVGLRSVLAAAAHGMGVRDGGVGVGRGLDDEIEPDFVGGGRYVDLDVPRLTIDLGDLLDDVGRIVPVTRVWDGLAAEPVDGLLDLLLMGPLHTGSELLCDDLAYQMRYSHDQSVAHAEGTLAVGHACVGPARREPLEGVELVGDEAAMTAVDLDDVLEAGGGSAALPVRMVREGLSSESGKAMEPLE